MKSTSATQKYNGAVAAQWDVSFQATAEEIRELRDALAVVARWQNAALKAAGTKEANADWTMIRNYRMQGETVTVTVDQGACG
jgi:hypothetical protein